MKKKGTFRVAALLLALVLMTSCFVGGTFAKYISKGSASDLSRVANWGLTISMTGNLYSDEYYGISVVPDLVGKENYPVEVLGWDHNTVDTISVASYNSEDVVAPGTHSNDNGLYISLQGKPEVTTAINVSGNTKDVFLSGNYTYAIMVPISIDYVATDGSDDDFLFNYSFGTVTDPDGLYHGKFTKTTYADRLKIVEAGVAPDDGGLYKMVQITSVEEDYYPVVYQLCNKNGTVISTGSASEILSRVASYFGPITSTTEEFAYGFELMSEKKVKPNTDISSITNALALNGFSIKWYWKYQTVDEPSDENSTIAIDDGDEYDTILGDMIAIATGQTKAYKIAVCNTDKITSGFYSELLCHNNDRGCYFTYGTEFAIAQLQNEFNISITATQVD